MGYFATFIATVGMLTNGIVSITSPGAHQKPSEAQERWLKRSEQEFRERQKAITSPEAWRTWRRNHIPETLIIAGKWTFKRTSDTLDLTQFPRKAVTFGCESDVTPNTKILVTPFATYLKSE